MHLQESVKQCRTKLLITSYTCRQYVLNHWELCCVCISNKSGLSMSPACFQQETSVSKPQKKHRAPFSMQLLGNIFCLNTRKGVSSAWKDAGSLLRCKSLLILSGRYILWTEMSDSRSCETGRVAGDNFYMVWEGAGSLHTLTVLWREGEGSYPVTEGAWYLWKWVKLVNTS